MSENNMPPLTQVDLDRMNRILSWQHQVDELKKENATLKDTLAAYDLYVRVSVERHEWPADIDTWMVTQSEAPEWQAWLKEDRRTRELAANAAIVVNERDRAYRELAKKRQRTEAAERERDRFKDRAYEAEAKVDDLTMRAEAAEHAVAFADAYARYYHDHELARAAGRESQHPYTFDIWYILSDDVGRRTRALMHEGELVISNSEGGFGPDEISIADSNMSELIARWMGLQLNGRGSLCPIKEGQIELGLVRLILERL